jgi:hypothetical protein
VAETLRASEPPGYGETCGGGGRVLHSLDMIEAICSLIDSPVLDQPTTLGCAPPDTS